MDWLEPYLRSHTVGLASAAVAGGAVLLAILAGLLSGWFRWRAARLSRAARRFQGRQKLAEELISSMAAEEEDLRRLVQEMEQAKAG